MFFFCGIKAGNPERAKWVQPSQSGSQSEHKIHFIFPAGAAIVYIGLWVQLAQVVCYVPSCIMVAMISHSKWYILQTQSSSWQWCFFSLRKLTFKPIFPRWKSSRVKQAVKQTIRQLPCGTYFRLDPLQVMHIIVLNIKEQKCYQIVRIRNSIELALGIT